MSEYGRRQIVAAFEAIDAELGARIEVTLIGGSVAVLSWLARSATKDIDVLYGADSLVFVTTSDRLRARLQDELPPVQAVSIAALPYGYEERCTEYHLGLPNLRVLLPEVHDWVIAKVARGNQEDIEAIAEVNEVHPLDTETLIERYLETEVVGRRSMFRTSLLAALSWWLPEDEVEQIEDRLAHIRAAGTHWREVDD